MQFFVPRLSSLVTCILLLPYPAPKSELLLDLILVIHLRFLVTRVSLTALRKTSFIILKYEFR